MKKDQRDFRGQNAAFGKCGYCGSFAMLGGTGSASVGVVRSMATRGDWRATAAGRARPLLLLKPEPSRAPVSGDIWWALPWWFSQRALVAAGW